MFLDFRTMLGSWQAHLVDSATIGSHIRSRRWSYGVRAPQSTLVQSATFLLTKMAAGLASNFLFFLSTYGSVPSAMLAPNQESRVFTFSMVTTDFLVSFPYFPCVSIYLSIA